METKNHTTANTISIPREKFLSMISQLQSNLLSMEALNPQPIPLKSILIHRLAFHAMDRLITMQETADLMNKSTGNKSQLIIEEQVAEFTKDLCGTEPLFIILKKYRDPNGGDPVPHPNWNERFSGIELVNIGAMLERMAENLRGAELQQATRNAGATVIQTGIARL